MRSTLGRFYNRPPFRAAPKRARPTFCDCQNTVVRSPCFCARRERKEREERQLSRLGDFAVVVAVCGIVVASVGSVIGGTLDRAVMALASK